MNLHQAEFIAGELIAFTGAAVGITGAWLQYRKHTPPDPERPPTTEYSSLNDD